MVKKLKEILLAAWNQISHPILVRPLTKFQHANCFYCGRVATHEAVLEPHTVKCCKRFDCTIAAKKQLQEMDLRLNSRLQ